jgi:peptide/nickel transport system permease protein
MTADLNLTPPEPSRVPLRSWVRGPLAWISLAWLTLLTVACALAPVLAPYQPGESDLSQVLAGPSRAHVLGADRLGRDVLSRLLYGGRGALLGAVEAMLVFVVIGVTAGLVAGYFGRWVDWLITRMSEIISALPGILVLLVVLAAFSHNEHAEMISFGMLVAPGMVRVVRAETMRVKGELYISAAQVAGLSDLRILRRHVLGRLATTITVQAALCMSIALVVQAGLGFLGLGAQEPAPSWGGLVNQAATSIQEQPFLLVPSGGVIALTVLALGLVADSVRDATAARWTRNTAAGLRHATLKPLAETRTPTLDAGLALLSVQDLCVSFPTAQGLVPVVTNVSLEVHAGEVLGIVGESGCGKSVTASAVLGLLPPSSEVTARSTRFDSIELVDLAPQARHALRGRRIAFISQEPMVALDPTKRVGALLGEAIRIHQGLSRRDAARAALDLLAQVNLPDPEKVASRYPFQLSGGMAQRVAIALALAGNPELLVADEPTTALDATIQGEIIALLRRLQRERGLAVIIITHDWAVVAALADRVAVMYAGQIVETASVDELLAQPAHPYTAGLLAADPRRRFALVDAGSAKAPDRLPTIPGAVPPPSQWPQGCRFERRCPYATKECASGAVALTEGTHGRTSRCLHSDVVLAQAEHAS